MARFIVLSLLLALPGSAEARRDKEVEALAEVQASQGKILAETAEAVRELRTLFGELQGMIQENNYLVQKQTDEIRRMVQEFDYRLTGLEERFSLVVGQLDEVRAAKGMKSGEAERAAYHEALAAINAQKYKEAVDHFTKFMTTHPNSSLADNAQYWKGEALYALKDFQNAVLEFQQVVKKFPKSDKVPGALLKQGYSFFELKSYLDAKAFLEKLVRDFPRSEEAAQARDRLTLIEKTIAGARPVPPPQPAQPPPAPAP